MRAIRLALALVLPLGALAAAPAAAQDLKLRPGLWAIDSHMKSAGGQIEAAMARMKESMAKMPEAQRKQMEQMMAARGVGMDPSGGADGGQALRVCISPEQANLNQIPAREGCPHQIERTSANSFKVSFACKNAQGTVTSQGSGDVTLNSATEFSGRYHMSSTQHGKAGEIDMSQQGHWLAADCGAIKPAPH